MATPKPASSSLAWYSWMSMVGPESNDRSEISHESRVASHASRKVHQLFKIIEVMISIAALETRKHRPVTGDSRLVTCSRLPRPFPQRSAPCEPKPHRSYGHRAVPHPGLPGQPAPAHRGYVVPDPPRAVAGERPRWRARSEMGGLPPC